jgi:predicted protein tyrosine phosphatase
MNTDVKIVSRMNMIDDLLFDRVKDRAVISINDDAYSATCMKNHAKDRCLRFHSYVFNDIDIVNDEPGLVPCLSHVLSAIEFAGKEDPVTVHCSAGVSRSSVIAFLILRNRLDGNSYKAIQYLDHRLHNPNRYICELAAEHFKDPSIMKLTDSVRKANDALYSNVAWT